MGRPETVAWPSIRSSKQPAAMTNAAPRQSNAGETPAPRRRGAIAGGSRSLVPCGGPARRLGAAALLALARPFVFVALLVFALGPSALARAGDAAVPGDVVEEPPTLHCLGFRWLVAGDDNRNAIVRVEYRRAGDSAWRRGPDLFRVETSAIREDHRPEPGTVLLAGSILGLKEDTPYEVRLDLSDPDGGGSVRLLRTRTWREPELPRGGRTIDVAPGELEAALSRSRPGDVLRLRAGVYRGTFAPRSGLPDRPIALVAFGDGEPILDGGGAKNVISAPGLSDVMFEGLTLRNATWGIAVNEGARITVRRCRFLDLDYGFVATRNGARQTRIYFADNELIGRSRWPRSEGIEPRRGIQLGGTGHVVCHNRIRGFADAINTFPAFPCAAIDVYGNEISECTDDGIELDGSEHNVRCFANRLTNVFQGISAQPVHGGPVYVTRNTMYNVVGEPFKLHNSPSGVLMIHNTSVKAGCPTVLATGESVSNCVSRNNLFVGTESNYAYESLAPMRDCDYDHDAFAGRWRLFMKWNGVRYESIERLRADGPAYRHALVVDSRGLFASGIEAPADADRRFDPSANDLRVRPGAGVIDAGVAMPGFNDHFAGKAPDIGAHELGDPLPSYGPRPRLADAASAPPDGTDSPRRDR